MYALEKQVSAYACNFCMLGLQAILSTGILAKLFLKSVTVNFVYHLVAIIDPLSTCSGKVELGHGMSDDEQTARMVVQVRKQSTVTNKYSKGIY